MAYRRCVFGTLGIEDNIITQYRPIISSLVACPLTPKYVTLNDFEWLEWRFYVCVKFSLLRTANEKLYVTYLLQSYFVYITHVTSGEVREAEQRLANSDPQNIRNPRKTADLSQTLYHRNLNKEVAQCFIVFPLTPKHVSLNDLESPFCVKFSCFAPVCLDL